MAALFDSLRKMLHHVGHLVKRAASAASSSSPPAIFGPALVPLVVVLQPLLVLVLFALVQEESTLPHAMKVVDEPQMVEMVIDGVPVHSLQVHRQMS